MEDLDRANVVGGPRGPPARRPGGPRPRLGRRRSSARASASTATTRRSTALDRGRADVRVLLHPAGDPRGGRRAARRAEGAYPGTCRDLTDGRARAAPPASGRRRCGCGRPASAITVDDALAGPFTGAVDDVVLRRNDGVPAYNLAVVVDDAAQGVTTWSAATTCWRRRRARCSCSACSGCRAVRYVHVPLVVGADGQRLAKRHGAVTLEDLAAEGVGAGTRRRRPGRVARAAGRRRSPRRATCSPASTSPPSPPSAGRRSRSPTCNDPGRERGRRSTTSTACSATAAPSTSARASTELGPDLLVVPFWTPRVLRGGRAGGRARRVRPRPRRSGARPRGVAGRDQPARCTRPCRTTSARGSGRSCSRCGR